MDINIDDDIIIIQDKTPVNPQEAAPQINHNFVTCSTTTNLNKTVGSGNNESGNIINLDSSDDETGANNVQASTPKLVYTGPTVTQNKTSNIITKSPILNTAIQKEIIDVDAEDTDALAPLRTFIDPTKNKTLSNTTNLISGNMSTATKRKAATIVSISKNNSSASYVRKTKNHTSQILDKHTENLNEPIHYYQGSINRRSYKQHSTSSQSIKNQIIPTLKPGFGVELADKSLSSTLKQLITIKDPTNRSSNNSSNVIKGDSNKPDILNSTNIADPNNQKLTYVGKIIRIPGQPCLIEDASGQIFRTDEFNANNSGEENNERSEENLYRNFLNNPYNLHKNVALRPEVPTSSDNILLNNILVQNSNTIVDGTPVIESQSNNMNIRHQGDLINKNLKNTSKNSAKKVSKKQKTNSKNIKNQVKNLLQKQYIPVLNPYLPQESNNTLLDLNLNINDGRPPTSTSLITNTSTQSQNAVTSLKNIQPGYNVAFGLVLNVNDPNEPMNSYQTAPPNKFGSLNNVALDVSFNLNNPPKPATITRQEERQNLLQQPAMELDSSEGILGQEVVNTAGQIYCCYLCSFKTTDIAVIGSHQCPVYSTGSTTPQTPVTSLNHLGCPNQDTEYQKQSDKRGYTGKSMRCCFCQFETLDFEHLKTHYSLGCTPEGNRSNVNTKKLKKYIRERIVSTEKMY